MTDKIQEIVELLRKRDKVIFMLVDKLTPRFRKPVIHVYIYGMTIADCASLMGVSKTEASHILHKAMDKLADEYYNYTVMNNIDKNSIYVLDLDKRLTRILIGHGIKTITDLEREARKGTLQDMRYIGDKYISDIKVSYKSKKGYDLVLKGSTGSMTDEQWVVLYQSEYGVSREKAFNMHCMIKNMVKGDRW